MKKSSRSASALSAVLASVPLEAAGTPAARWGHQAVYVPSQQAMYVVGGQVQSTDTQVTNEVLVLPLNSSSASFSTGSDDSLPPHAFATLGLSNDGTSLVVIGGMTSSCASDGVTHSLALSGNGTWTSVTPGSLVRRRGAGMALIDNGSTEGEMLLVGGIADSYSCASSTYSYPAADVLSLPLNTASVVSTRSLPTTLTGSDLTVADFGMTKDPQGNIYVAGGQDSNGDLVSFSSIGKWTKAGGWATQATTGDVPAGRIGASLVAHPTLDMLVLHGGSVSSSGSDTPTALLALLNTTTWTWSTPSNLQPPTSSSVSYHSAVMTPSGVMISAFGLSASNTPRSDMYYLDLRDPTGNAWTWKSQWSSSMLSAYTTTTSTGTTTNGNTNSGVVAAGSDTSDSSAPSSKKVTSIVVPIVVILLLLTPVIVYFIRRKVRMNRKRRMARHFSFSSQEDSGDFRGPLDQFRSSRQTRTQYSFGQDANEKEGNFLTDIAAGVSGLWSKFSTRSNGSDVDGGDHARSREMEQVSRGRVVSKGSKWEEIDFGLGRLDESKHFASSRRSSFSDNGDGNVPMPIPMPMPMGMTSEQQQQQPLLVTINSDSPRLGTPTYDNQGHLVPSLAVIPATAPATPAEHGNVSSLATAYPAMAPTPVGSRNSTGTAAEQDNLDWNSLQQELETKPAFRSISPTSTLRSHAHSSPSQSPSTPSVRPVSLSAVRPLPVVPWTPTSSSQASQTASPVSGSPYSPISPVKRVGPAPHLPPFEFQRPGSMISTRSTPLTGDAPVNGSGTVSLVQRKNSRRVSEILPFSHLASRSPRSVSGPTVASRQLAGRRDSAPALDQSKTANPASPVMDAEARRASSGSLAAYPTATTTSERRGSQLRVMNFTEADEADESQPGQAL